MNLKEFIDMLNDENEFEKVYKEAQEKAIKDAAEILNYIEEQFEEEVI